MKATKYTNKELVEIYKNLKTSAKILGFASASDCEMMVAIELEAVKRHLNLIDGTVEETAELETETNETTVETTAEQTEAKGVLGNQNKNMKEVIMNLSQAQKICQEIESEYAVKRMQGSVKWNDVFSSEQEILAALGKIYIPKSRTAPVSTFKGYAYIYSFAYYVQQGWTLSDKQMKQCKRLAVEIRKAAAIAEYKYK